MKLQSRVGKETAYKQTNKHIPDSDKFLGEGQEEMGKGTDS